MTGPYNHPSELRDAPVVAEVRQLHRENRVRSGDPDNLVRDTVLRHLTAACTDSGVQLGALDLSVLRWLADWDTDTVQVIIGIIRRAGHATPVKPETQP